MAANDLSGLIDALSLLECPLCLETMRPPIYICTNGHNICGKCMQGIDICSECRADFSNTRNLLAERMSSKVGHSCKYQTDGCVERYLLIDLPTHELACFYRLFECKVEAMFPEEFAKCKWSGKYSDLFQHVKDTHSAQVMEGEKLSFIIHSVPKCSHPNYCKIINAPIGLFWITTGSDPKRGFKVAVQYIGPAENAKKYKYEVSFSSNSGWKLNFENYAHSLTEDLRNIIQSNLCFYISRERIKEILIDQKFSFELRIKKSKDV